VKKRIVILGASLWLCLFLCGCSLASFDTKNLMAPPKANQDQQAIQALLQGNRLDITLVYPQSGEYRSAIIMHDFTGDGEEDAIGFYSTENTGAGGVEVQFLSKTEEGWESTAVFQNTALQVDRVCFGTLSQSGRSLILIGWGSTTGSTGRTAAVNAYVYSLGGEITEYSLGPYAEMTLTDFDRDGVNEVFTVDKFLPAEVEGDEPTPAKARVFTWSQGAMREAYSVDADNSISSYSAAVFGKLTPSFSGVALDGVKADGSMTTQIFYTEGNTLKNAPEGVNTEEYGNPFQRPSTASFPSRDLDGDGLLELPVVSLLPGLPETLSPDSTCYQVNWCHFQKNDLTLTLRAMMNPAENYWFRLPYYLNGKITSANDAERRVVTYSEIIETSKKGEYLLGEPLFSIRVFTRSSWESRGTSSGYEQLLAQNDSVYGIQTLTRDETMLRYIQQIKRDFKLLSE